MQFKNEVDHDGEFLIIINIKVSIIFIKFSIYISKSYFTKTPILFFIRRIIKNI